MNDRNLMNWLLDSRKTQAQVTAHPAHKKVVAARAFEQHFTKVDSRREVRLLVDAQNLTDMRIKEYSQRVGYRACS